MFEKRMLKQILQPKRDLVTEDWRRLCNEQSHNQYSSKKKNYAGDQVKKYEMGGSGGKCGGEKKRIQILGEKPEGKRPLGRPRFV
jgi:hypothetical protein